MTLLYTISYHMLNYMDEDKFDKFMPWAFGKDFKKFTNMHEYRMAWNDRHGKELLLYPNGILSVDAKSMAKLYEKHLMEYGD